MAKTPKYLSDTPYGEDFFKIHSKIAETLFGIIKSEDVSKNSFTLGLLGSWGSGKSLTVGKLKEKLEVEKDILFLEFDIWKYIDTSLYRSILIDLEKSLRVASMSKKITEEFKDGYKSDKGENLYDLLYSHTEFVVAQEEKHKSKLLKKIKEWERNKILRLFSYLILRPVNLACLMFSYVFKRIEILVLIITFIGLLILTYLFRDKIYHYIPFTSSSTFKFIIKLFIGSIFGVAALEFLKEFFKDAYKELTPKVNKNIVITSPPTFAQDQFESIFKDIIKKICVDKKKKIVIVFDNIDRCETDVTLKVLTGLKTFLDVPNCFYLIPCDDNRIKKHFTESRSEDDFLDKIFQAYLRIPLLTEENKFEFVEKCLIEADFDFQKSDQNKIEQILTLAYKGETPRQIKRFFNDFVSYYKLAKTIDPDEKFLLKDIAHFTFMITIKQKWPLIEEILIKNPNAFVNFSNSQSRVTFPTDFTQYLQTCISWIDLESNIADFIYLTDAKQTGSNIQRIILENFDGFTLNQPILKDFDLFLSSLITEGRYIFLEKSIDRLMNLTENFLKEASNINGIDLFKLYVKHVIQYDSMGYDNKKPSYLISHAAFFIKNVDLISKLDRNNIRTFENHACKIIRKVGFRDDTLNLYKTFISKFHPESIALIFENCRPEELVKLNGFITNTSPDFGLKVIPVSYFQQLAAPLSFVKKESETLSIINHFKKNQQLKPIREPIADKVNQVLATFYSHPGLHPYDEFILDGIKIIDKADWNVKQKNSVSTYIHHRISILIQHGHTEQSVDYCIHAMGNFLNNFSQFLRPDNVLGSVAPFNLLIQRLPNDILEMALEDDGIRDQLFVTATTHNVLPSILAKISDQYLKEKTSRLVYSNVDSIISVLENLQARRSLFTNEEHLEIEKRILSAYSQNHADLIVGSYAEIISKLGHQDNKESFIEIAIKHYNQNANQNSSHITSLLKANETNSGFLDKTYETNKIQFQSIDAVEFFEFLFYNQLFKKKSDYLERILLRDLSALRAGGIPSNIIKTLERVDIALLNERKNTLSLVINELIEQSRSEEDNTIGIKLYNRVKETINKLDPSIKNKIEILKNIESKSDVLKQLVASIQELS